MFANIVDRIRLATRGQDATRQVVQELRAVLSGQSRPSDMLAMIFGARDTDFRQKITDMVASGDGMGVLKYMNSLMTQSQGLLGRPQRHAVKEPRITRREHQDLGDGSIPSALR